MGPRELGRLGYFLDTRHHLLCRAFVPYRLGRRVRPTDRCHPALEDVQRVRFDYLGANKEGDLRWFEHWDDPEPPVAIKASVEVKAEGRSSATHTFVVYLGAPPSDDAS